MNWTSSTHLEEGVQTRDVASAESDKPLDQATAAGQPGPAVQRLDALFNLRALAYPGVVAVIAGDEQLTYRQLQERARQLARRLRALGVQPGELVGLCAQRSADMVVGVIGILMAGAAYVPLDPDYPPERLRYLLDDAGARVLVSQRVLGDRFSQRSQEIVYLDERPESAEKDSAVLDSLPRFDGSELAYVIYTSGSTGRPKGVMITHRMACNTILDVNERFQIGAGDAVLGMSSLCFDLSVYDVFGMLVAGGTIVIPQSHQLRVPTAWVELIDRHQITVWNSVPAFMEMLTTYSAAAPRELSLASLRRVLLSGDWIAVSLPDKIRACAPGATIISLGGATEVSIWSIYHPIDRVDPGWKSIPYGKPLAGQTVYVLDAELRQCPPGVTGEIYIGGEGVALGYHNRSELTSERFIPDPYAAHYGDRLYRTGDLGSYFADGNIEFLGRVDHQVKINGFRIELGEIESTLVRHPEVVEAVVVARQGAGSAKYLAAYLVNKSDAAASDDQLAEYCSRHLPHYMIPARFVHLPRLPLSVNGKVDRAALPNPEIQGPDSRSVSAPQTPTDAGWRNCGRKS